MGSRTGRNAGFLARAGVAAFVAALAGSPASALTIVPTFDSSVTSNANSAAIQAAVNFVCAEYAALYDNAITIRITVVADPGTGTFGGSSTNLQGLYTYAQIKGFLSASGTTADDATALASLGASDPTGGGNFLLAFAQAKALGQRAAADPATDGTFHFGAGQPFNFDPNNRAVAGKYDFCGVVEHEFSEIMGRIAGLNKSGFPYWLAHDMFRYTASGVRNLSNTPPSNVYFSINGGVTNMHGYANSVDLDDWDGSSNDAYMQFANASVKLPISAGDVRQMDVLGYRLTPPCPEDINHDGIINTVDLGSLLSHFGQSVPAGTLGDIDGNGLVNTVDLGKLLSKFGTSCPVNRPADVNATDASPPAITAVTREMKAAPIGVEIR